MISSISSTTETSAPLEKPVDKPQRPSLSQRITSLLDDGKQKNAIPALDGFRAIACLLVVVFHLNFLARESGIWHPIHDLGTAFGIVALGGDSGVLLFFVLSGFLLFLPYAKALLFEQKLPSARSFYLRRVFRILPAYYVALILLVLLREQTYLQPNNWGQLGLFFTFLMDLHITYQKLNGPFWTLAVEFQFYAWLPVLAWMMSLVVQRGTVRRRLISLFGCLLAMIIWGLGTRYWGNKIVTQSPLDYLQMPRTIIDVLRPIIFGSSGKYFEAFGTGMLMCMLYIYIQSLPINSFIHKIARRLSPFFFILGLSVLSVMAVWHFYMWYFNYALHPLDPFRQFLVDNWGEWQAFCYSVGFSLCIFGILYAPALLKRPFEWGPLRWIGLISYGMYIWHLPLQVFFIQMILPPLKGEGMLHRITDYGIFCIWNVLIVVGVSLASYLVIEKPFIKIGERLRRKRNDPQMLLAKGR
ncbi:hypothetical protein KSD_08710 [Ktedonobacter sp. SOSP1-85]|uniref:acyltransferase family protein n=1 Tax=Ktedonobacter sp. SOSP1-85 TaxID=2778367 RepID=UPI0019162D78|nr:acyltransferase [Ktedonobacter sp. SOSP1-85]GHO73100.1 hypothetical protein KSD_08710 [Ktedonobacter sp. SOSP1-85]